MPADASSPIPLAFDQLREHPGSVPGETPGLLEHLAEVPDPLVTLRGEGVQRLMSGTLASGRQVIQGANP